MASIFSGGDSLPPWLRVTPADNEGLAARLGNTLGTNLAAGVRWATQSDNDNPVDPATGKQQGLSFDQAYQEARLSQANPLWRLGAQLQRGQILEQGAQWESMNAMAEARVAENRAWMNEAPSVSKWLTMTPDARATAPAPQVTSQRGMAAIQSVARADDQYQARLQANEIARIRAEASTVSAKTAAVRASTFEKGLAALTDATAQAQIAGMKRNPDGTPSADQEAALAAAKEADRIAAQNARTQAEIEARAAGMVPTTKLDAKGGVSVTYAPPKAGAGGVSELKTVQLPGGETGVYMEGSKAIHIIKSGVDAMRGKAALEKKARGEIAYSSALAKEVSGPAMEAIKAYRDEGRREFDELFTKKTAPAPAASGVTPSAPLKQTNSKDPLGLFE